MPRLGEDVNNGNPSSLLEECCTGTATTEESEELPGRTQDTQPMTQQFLLQRCTANKCIPMCDIVK